MSVAVDEDQIKELKEWLFGRVADDNDIVVDDLQEEFSPYFEEVECKAENVCKGSKEYQINMEQLAGSIAKLKESKEGRDKMKAGEDVKKKLTDGFRTCYYKGMTNKEGYPDGEGVLVYENKDVFKGKFSNGILDREGKLSLSGGLTIEGKWQDGLMEGEMRLDTEYGGWIEGYYHHGVPHGFQREFGIKEHTMAERHTLKFVGRFFRGIARGFCWKGQYGGGFLCGFVDANDGSFTGDDCAFIYPDFKMALRGQFKDGLLVRAQVCHLVGSRMERGLHIPVFTRPSGEVFEFEEPSRLSIAKHPLLPDPWEDSLVYVSQSTLQQGGEGLFAKAALPKGHIIAFYNGVRLNTSSLLLEYRYGESDYRIRLNAEVDLDIPKGSESLSAYKATLGHKVNHSFENNAEWLLVEHPRFGLIRGLRAAMPIEKDQEILINYSMNLADSPMWYRVVWLRHQRYVKKASDAAIKRIIDRYAENTSKRIEIPESEELDVPEPKGISNMDDLPGDDEIEANTNKAYITELKRQDQNGHAKDDEDMLPKIQEIED